MSFDFSGICRCCLSDRSESLQTIFDSRIFNIFTECTGLQPTPDDGLPATICSQCVFKCIAWESFKQLCERTESALRTQLGAPQCNTSLDIVTVTTTELAEDVPRTSTVSCVKECTAKFEPNCILDRDAGNEDEPETTCFENIHTEVLDDDDQAEIALLQLIESDQIQSPDEEHQQLTTADEEAQPSAPSPIIARKSSTPATASTTTCPICNKHFATPRSLQRHKPIHTVGRPFQCAHCDRAYKFKSSLSLHSRQHRTDAEPYVCDLCGKSFLRVHGLQSHMLTHSTALPFACAACPKRFKNEAMLRNHQARHAAVKRFMCDECGKGFATGAELRTHSRSHTGLKPYQCAECPKSYKTRTHLTVHMRVHTGERPYACEFCAQKFAHKMVCEQHRMTHTGEKPHTCDVCNRSFRQRNTLMAHAKTHHSSTASR